MVVDSNAVLPFSVALQGFKSVAGQRDQIHKLDSYAFRSCGSRNSFIAVPGGA
jgi:hypothetical protein